MSNCVGWGTALGLGRLSDWRGLECKIFGITVFGRPEFHGRYSILNVEFIGN